MYEIIKNSLTYPVQIGDQKIVLPDNSIFKKLGLVDLEHFYQTRTFLNHLYAVKYDIPFNFAQSFNFI